VSYIPLDMPYCTTADLDRLERRVQRAIYNEGYASHGIGLLLKDCPPYQKKW
jgi:hypothetical protein